jgi:hypothetical protein
MIILDSIFTGRNLSPAELVVYEVRAYIYIAKEKTAYSLDLKGVEIGEARGN